MSQNHPPEGPPQGGINIELGEKEAEGVYSNFVVLTHNQFEFVLDFARILPGIPKGKVYSRIVMTPHHTKMLHQVLEQNLKKYEESHGKISLPGDNPSRGIGF